MSKPYTNHDNIVRVIECHKIGLNSRQISEQTGVKERSVRRLMNKFKASGESQLPFHKHGGGWIPKICKRTLVIRRQLDEKPTLTARQLKEQNPILLKDVSVRIIQSVIQKRLKYRKVAARKKPLVTNVQRKKRVAFVKKCAS
ncbi:hypothetical protein Pcinc_005241 [Petrolisthes cinctipes]|uniref:Transposase n=1 Tax=Petrolisthes cinctipes TaxID=88211 RepID=A0AAE1GFJ4_PETCI|nr:hypothetical protein Pcinc_005241 [Petrolisthes cinctipes]